MFCIQSNKRWFLLRDIFSTKYCFVVMSQTSLINSFNWTYLMKIGKSGNSLDRLSIIYKSHLSGKIKEEFFQAVAVSVLLFGCTTIFIIMSCRRHGYPWLSLATSPNCSSRLACLQGYPVSSHTCCMYVWAGCPARPYVEFHRSTSLMSSSLLLQQCPACLVRLIWIVFVMGGRWPYNWCLVGCWRQHLFNIARNILV